MLKLTAIPHETEKPELALTTCPPYSVGVAIAWSGNRQKNRLLKIQESSKVHKAVKGLTTQPQISICVDQRFFVH
ncbi:hypothetical protein QUB80_31495 [Chlorogloeopsis sp. ULAP01]|uniref:hypothetical protein n=1 Tax=Chlorogloeopsis sp. ULAP01 TaxID=3056483 RepID=UPI0025AB3950|nr:hypothetical protein [Chlorogloeopsis sp. ULAP01]MDM9385180.1 hypothetical protein [Chlorogloeopsis sp. ULAP01]